jgi:hypothetical protein
LSTPKALANFSLGLERSDNPRITLKKCIYPERVSSQRTLSGFMKMFDGYPGFSLHSNPGLKLANAFGVLQLTHYSPFFIPNAWSTIYSSLILVNDQR